MKGIAHLVITSIANSENKALNIFADEYPKHIGHFIVIGDKKSPPDFTINQCDYYSIARQTELPYRLSKSLPTGIYSRKNIGYLVAMNKGATIIIETDDDNFPNPGFWEQRILNVLAHEILDTGWVNVYKYFTARNIWPRGFPLEEIRKNQPESDSSLKTIHCPIQQGLANDNPDVDAVYRLTSPLPLTFTDSAPVALGFNAWCPFNSQNTTWFREAFPLLYLPTYCNFRMTDIWRSFVAQRIAWVNNWHILFHNATVYQERNDHDFLADFKDEIPGYLNNKKICSELLSLDLQPGTDKLFDNLIKCYQVFIDNDLMSKNELILIRNWDEDCSQALGI